MTIVKTNSCNQFAGWLKCSPDTMMLKLTAPILRNSGIGGGAGGARSMGGSRRDI
jgi:hypothetical protein